MNVFVSRDSQNDESNIPRIKLGDFGSTADLSRVRGKLGRAGTPIYMAPEVGSAKLSKAVDIWSLGVVLYSLIDDEIAGLSLAQAEALIH